MDYKTKLLNGIYIDRYKLDHPKDKPTKLSGWKFRSLTADEWLRNYVDAGFVVAIADINKCPDRSRPNRPYYSHKKDLWISSTFIGLDGDNFEYTEDDGKIVSGVKPHNGTVLEWKDQNRNLINEIYALGESLSTLLKGDPPHRRFRIWIYLEEPIDNEEDYKSFLRGFSAEYPFVVPDKRSPLQPVFGSCANKRTLRDGEIEEKRLRATTEIFGNVISKERMQSFIEKGQVESVKEKEESKDREEKQIMEAQEKDKDSIIMKKIQDTNFTDTYEEEDQVKMLGRSFQDAKSFLEEYGSTYAGEINGGYRFHRNGKDDGYGEVLFQVADGTLIFYAHSGNSHFVESGYCDAKEAILFSTLYRRAKYPGKSRFQFCEIIAREFPHLDNGWKSKFIFEDLNPISAINYSLEVAKKYITEVEGEEALDLMKPRIIAEGYDNRVACKIGDRWTYFKEYWAFKEDVEEDLEILKPSVYDHRNRDHRRIYANLNNLAARHTGNTGTWNKKKNNKISLDIEE